MQLINTIFSQKDIRNKIIYSIIIIGIYRLGSHIPIGGVDMVKLRAIFEGGIFDFLNLFSGGGLTRFSIFALGILPYINASIIMQLMVVVYPKLKEISDEGEYGRKKISQYTRYLAIGLSFVQGFFISMSLTSVIAEGVAPQLFYVYATLSLVAGASVVMWFGELITENGLGNGASLLIFVGIISMLPTYIIETKDFIMVNKSVAPVFILVLVFLLLIWAIVYIQEAQRRVNIQYAKRVVGRKMYASKNTYIPLRLIQGGVMPIIFASALLQFPTMMFQYIQVESISVFIDRYYSYDSILYNCVFCLMIFFFTYFYTAITFNPKDLSDNIRKHGGFITGIRPGEATTKYLDRIISRLTFIGATCLTVIAVVPIIAANMTKVTSLMGLGGTALLIIVGVGMDLVKQIETLVISKRYDKLI